MKKRYKSFTAVLLAVVLITCMFSIIPAQAASDENQNVGETSGTVGDCWWTLDNEGTLTIKGTGAMEIYHMYNNGGYHGVSQLWWGNDIKKVVIGYGVTSIGDYAFSGCSNLASITIPDSVTSIGTSAFSGCSSLTSVLIPDGVKSIDANAFSGCSSLTSIKVSQNNNYYDSRNNCNAVIERKTNKLLFGCKNTIIPDGVTSIGDYAFSGCSSLSIITIPYGVSNIGKSAFYNCTSLTSITIPDGVTSIGDLAFGSCTSLTSITIPDDIMSIGWDAFQYCKSLNIINIPDSLTSIGNGAFGGTAWYNNQPDGMVYAGKVAYRYKGTMAANTSIALKAGTTGIAGSAFSDCSNLTSITIPDSVTSIGAYAFRDCSNLTSVMIPDGVTSIEFGVFQNCKNLTSIIFSDSVTSIGDSAFFNCASLTSITIPDSVTSIGASAFYETAWYNNQSDGLVYAGKVAYKYKGTMPANTSIEIKDGTKGIAGYAFSCPNLTSITIPDSVTSIGYFAFGSCTSLTSITIPDSVTSIGDSAFFNCASLTNITISNSVVSIGAEAFGGCRSLTSIDIPDSVTSIGAYAFRDCLNLKTITIPDSVTSIGRFAFGLDTYYGGFLDPETLVKVDGFTICGYKDSAAEIYANHNGFSFITLDLTDNEKPTVSLSSTNSVASSQTVTISLSDNVGIKGYYWGTNSNYINNSYTETANPSVLEIINTSGTYYATAVDTFGNVSSTVSITFYKTTLNANGGSVSPSSVLTKSGNSFTFPTPTRSGSYVYNGWSTSSSATSGVKSLTPSSNSTYYAVWKTKSTFVWGQDNWNFLNSAPTYFPSSTYRNQINSTYANKLKSNLTNSEYQVIFGGSWYSDAWLDDRWGGSCYGMSSLAFLSMNDLFPYSNYKSGATKLHDLGYPKNNTNQLSLITYYQMIQVKGVIQQQYRTVPNKSHKENITNLINLLDKNSTVLVGFKKAGWGGHAILATGYEYGSWTFNGVSYQGCIKICDPNASTNYNTRYNIYFNTNSYNWIIPAYKNMTSIAGAKFNYIGANVNEINNGGYLSETANGTVDDYVARIDAYAISDDCSVSKVFESNGVYMNQSSQPGEIVEDYSFILGNESEGTIGYNLYDSSSSYKVSQDNAERLQLSMDYENCLLSGGSAAGSSVIFDKSGYVEVNGESAMYNISETFDDSYSTDWFTIQAQGYNANKASLRMVDDGYVLTADKLENVTLKANNREHTARTAFSTNYTSVFIYEIDEDTIGLKIDTDNNGTYETELSANEDSTEIGDVNGDNSIDVLDATVVQKYAVDKTTLTDKQKDVADVNDDGVVDILDATLIQKYAVDKITEFKKK